MISRGRKRLAPTRRMNLFPETTQHLPGASDCPKTVSSNSLCFQLLVNVMFCVVLELVCTCQLYMDLRKTLAQEAF
jgi:hypothetical protein